MKLKVFLTIVMIFSTRGFCFPGEEYKLAGIESVIIIKNYDHDIDEKNIHVLLRHLCRSAEWRVMRMTGSKRGSLIAVKRKLNEKKELNETEIVFPPFVLNKWISTNNGFITDFSDKNIIETRVTIGFDQLDESLKYTDVVPLKSLNRSRLKKKVYKLNKLGSHYYSNIRLKTKSFYLEIYERSKNKKREFTIKEINKINNEFKRLIFSKRIKNREGDKTLLPETSLKYGDKAELYIDPVSMGGEYF